VAETVLDQAPKKSAAIYDPVEFLVNGMYGENGAHVARPAAVDWKQEHEKSSEEKLLVEHHALGTQLNQDLVQ